MNNSEVDKGFRRGSLEISMDILRACKTHELGLTHLLNTTRLNVAVTQKETKDLEKRGLLSIMKKQYKTQFATHNSKRIPNHALTENPHRKTRRAFLTTPEGLGVLAQFDQFMKLWEDSDKPQTWVPIVERIRNQ